MRDAEPERYGFFASLPSLLDGELALKELAYAMDELKADGVTLFTRYGAGNHYLGHPDFKEMWAELDRREAVVFVHPTHPVDTTPIRPGLPQSLIEYPFETTKTAADMLYSKIPQTHKKCKIILSHAGGTIPYLISRPAGRMGRGTVEYEEFMDAARSFYFDLAVSCHENVFTLLQKFAKPGHILFGTDFPYAPAASIANNVPRLDEFEFDRPGMHEDINNKSALALFPRLAKYYTK